MIPSLSSSSCVSQSVTIVSILLFVAASKSNAFMICSSRSKTFVVYQRMPSLSALSAIKAPISANLPSNSGVYVWWETCGFFSLANSTARNAAALMPSPFKAEMGNTSQPSSSPSFFISIVSPFRLTTSIMFNANSTGTPTSTNCVVKYKLRSKLDASTIFKITSGRSLIIYVRATISSVVYGDNE